MNTGVSYRAYLIRLWRAADGQWRAALEDPHTGERRAFATLERLWEHLLQATQSDSGQPLARRPEGEPQSRM